MDSIEAPNAVKRGRGRPFGAKGYASQSLISKTFKERGIRWIDEMIDAYMFYKAELKDGKLPDPSLLYFWQEMVPYIVLTMADKYPRGAKPKRVFQRRISSAAVERLIEAEGRKQ